MNEKENARYFFTGDGETIEFENEEDYSNFIDVQENLSEYIELFALAGYDVSNVEIGHFYKELDKLMKILDIPNHGDIFIECEPITGHFEIREDVVLH